MRFLPLIIGPIVLATLIALAGSSCLAQQEDEPSLPLKIASAEETVAQTESRFQIQKRLVERGSISKREFRRTQLDRDLAVLELAKLQKPEEEENIELLAAKRINQFLDEEFQIAKRLFERGSLPKREYEYYALTLKISSLEVEQLESRNDQTRYDTLAFKVAVAKLERARNEFEWAERMFDGHLVTQSEYDEMASRLRIAELEVKEKKSKLGASATVIINQDKTP